MPTHSPPDRAACFHTLFGPRIAKGLAEAPWAEICAAATTDEHPLTRKWLPHERVRLAAVVRLCALYYPATIWPVERLMDEGDVVRRFLARTRTLTMRTLWLVCEDAAGCVTDEALLLMGGHPTKPPPLSGVLRQAVLKQATSLWIVDFRTIERLDLDPATDRACANLNALCGTLGVALRGWVILGPNGAGGARPADVLGVDPGKARAAA